VRTPDRDDYINRNNEIQFQKIRIKFFKEIPFFDFQKMILNDNNFLDAGHLNFNGANKFSL
jgi:hypothetical protein